MPQRRYWNGFAVGAAIGVGAGLGALLLSRLLGGTRIIRLQKSVQIGCPVEGVFDAWSTFEQMVAASPMIQSITRHGNRSHWTIVVDGREIAWDAEVEQFIPNQAIGWKSLNGPKHTGRVSFAPIGNDTLVNVTMNYAPPVRFLRGAAVKERVQHIFEQVLRDFKGALEAKQGGLATGTTGTHYHTAETRQATGTLGTPPERTVSTQQTRFGGPANPVEYTRPPETKS
jgi:uncharacterized membrane protein